MCITLRIKSDCAAVCMMGTPVRLADVRRLGRDETLWMIDEMGWTPETFPDSGETALMRRQFRTAIARCDLQDVVLEAEA